jgi:hypothetical protein
VDKLDASLHPGAYRTLYEKIKFKGHTDQPQVLMLWRRIKLLPASVVLDNVRAQLEKDFQRFLGQIIEGIEKTDYSQSSKIYEMVGSKEGELIMNKVVTAIVGKFEACTLEQTLLLIRFSMRLLFIGNSCFFVDVLLKMFKARKLLESEHSLHLYAHTKYLIAVEPFWKNEQFSVQKLCIAALNKLAKFKTKFFEHYQRYVEHKNQKKIRRLHEQNWQLSCIVSEFVTWYYKKEDLSRVQKLLLAARSTDFTAVHLILTQLHCEMLRFQQLNTNEAFCLFNELKRYMTLDSPECEAPEVKAAFNKLKAEAPKCLHLLLWPEDETRQQLRVVNKFYDSPLWVQQEQKLFCFSGAEDEQTCSVSVDPNTALTSFSFKSGDACWKLDALESESMARVALIGARWKLKAVDEQHVKIFTDDGTF